MEFVVFLVQKYYEGLNKGAKAVFADVHFMLFYCAIFNAIQSCFMAIAAFRVSNRAWVRTEQLELDHYIEIREEFDRIDNILYGNSGDSSSSYFVLEYSPSGLKKLAHRMYRFVRHPILSRKHKELMVQVRFHDLRVHFLKANNLPLRLKVSDYLMRAELHVLQKLVHISAFAWLLLTGLVNLIYFLMGIVVYVTNDLAQVGVSMTYIYLCSVVFFVLLSLVIYNKMKWVFSRIMRMRLLGAETNEFKSGVSIRKGEKHVENQLELFWGGSPHYITVLIQFMQFGFAIALSILLVFWDDINVPGSPVGGYAFVVAVLACYAAFVATMAQVIPWYTLCTSLGQLVDSHRLQETVAAFHLEEAQRKRRERLEYQGDHYFDMDTIDDASSLSKDSPLTPAPPTTGQEGGIKTVTQSVRTVTQSERSKLSQKSEDSKPTLLAELVQMDTGSLRNALPVVSNSTRTKGINERRMRRKAVSDGVALMQSMTRRPDLPKPGPKLTQRPERVARQKSNSASGAIEQMKAGNGAKPTPRLARQKSLSASGKIEQMKTGKDEASDLQASSSLIAVKPLIDGRVVRQKSNSASTAIERMKAETGKDMLALSTVEKVALTPASLGIKQSTSGLALSQQLEGHPVNDEMPTEAVEDVHISSSANDMTSLSGGKPSATTYENTTLPPTSLAMKPSTSGQALSQLLEDQPLEDEMPAIETRLAVGPVIVSTLEDVHDIGEAEKDQDDCNSDIFDIPAADMEDLAKHSDEFVAAPSLYDRACSYFLSPRYPVVSAVFGTLSVFFVIGQRIEGLLLATGALPDNKNTFQFALGVSFWWETAYLCCFLVASSFITFAFRTTHESSNKERALLLGSVIDIVISGTCLVILMIAEWQRCNCSDGDDTADCCPAFGTRSYGGVGNIEPFTSLIALRLVRFLVAKRIVRLLGIPAHAPNHKALLAGRHGHSHHNGAHGAGEHDTALDLWQEAVSKHPDVVAKHGEFSGELLQAMLGIDIIEDKKPASAEEEALPVPGKADPELTPKPAHRRRKSLTVEEKYADLSPDVQGIIVAGMVGHDVQSKMTNPISSTVAPRAPLEFDLVTVPSEDGNEALTSFVAPSFIAPNAKLLRSMRRCDRTLLPLLDTWTAVDVVITKHEIVYFDAHVDVDSTRDSSEDVRAIWAIRQALKATKGGKGLRLRDVAMGRKVVGHLAISAVDSIHVDRILPHDGGVVSQENDSTECHLQTEYWEGPDANPDNAKDIASRQARWSKVKEDRLLIHSIYGSLCLRFYSDLDDSEINIGRCLSENEDKGSLFKNNAFLWCQTVSRLCKRAQLKQNLAHYKENNDDELRDYLRVVDPKAKEGHDGVIRMLRRMGSGLVNHGPLRPNGDTSTSASTVEVVTSAPQSSEVAHPVDDSIV